MKKKKLSVNGIQRAEKTNYIKKKKNDRPRKKKRMFNTFTQKHTIINSRLETKVQT